MQTPSEDEIDLLDMTADGSSGTLVVWEKVDRLLKNYNNKSSANVALKRRLMDLLFICPWYIRDSLILQMTGQEISLSR